MRDASISRKPRFSVGDLVTIIGPAAGANRGQLGIVAEITGAAGDYVYRYHVRLKDGSYATLFGFELELTDSDSH